ncbi:Uracil DNA glycosylase superfamily protein [Corynebacterium ciconiae DSM 44920]|uniref:uracil-DNA glycosylase n=1 Tax=Corynebacterium ciconiae TaxID=227319 RepID=UPI00037B7301|nr:uracil-DNA glycosylase [Corynebacterium ciconiae]WKD62171.1 Uracil DNA glycosylase superfamily protein [Corynebacterium ciconiae DSM 44920]
MSDTPAPHPITGQCFSSPVPPGTGWPEDPATAATPVAHSANHCAQLAASAETVQQLQAVVSVCAACPRLVEWRAHVARTKRAAFRDQPYWSRPVPSFGSTTARRVIVGLAPSAHGSNRTGRNFAGDPAGEWLYRALFKAGACNQPESVAAGDGLQLSGARIIPAVHCAPPGNAPHAEEKHTCRAWSVREMELLQPVAILALGRIGWDSVFQIGRRLGWEGVSPRPRFGHNTTATVRAEWGEVRVVGCYHPSQRNTATGLLSEEQLDAAVTTFMAVAQST